MRAATSVQDFLAKPIGAYFAARSFVVWYQTRLSGAFVVDELHPTDEQTLSTLLLSPVLAGHDLLCDLSGVERFDERGFAFVQSFLDARPDLLALVGRFALVRPGGLVGASMLGVFIERINPFVPSALFSDRAEALTWLGYAADCVERLEIDRMISTIHNVPLLVRRLRDYLAVSFATATVGDAARALETSERTLQRELADAQTTFRQELGRARVRVAESLLANTDTPIEAIAHQLGFASVPAFTTMFGRALGENPDEFRRRCRGKR